MFWAWNFPLLWARFQQVIYGVLAALEQNLLCLVYYDHSNAHRIHTFTQKYVFLFLGRKLCQFKIVSRYYFCSYRICSKKICAYFGNFLFIKHDALTKILANLLFSHSQPFHQLSKRMQEGAEKPVESACIQKLLLSEPKLFQLIKMKEQSSFSQQHYHHILSPSLTLMAPCWAPPAHSTVNRTAWHWQGLSISKHRGKLSMRMDYIFYTILEKLSTLGPGDFQTRGFILYRKLTFWYYYWFFFNCLLLLITFLKG